MGTDPVTGQNLVRHAGTTYAKGAIVGRTRRETLDKLRHEQRAGLIHSAGELALITRGHRAGQYAIPVYLITSPRPARRRAPEWIQPVLALSVLAGSLAWLLTALSAVSLGLFLGVALLAFLGRLKLKHGRPGRGATVTTTVTFR